MPDGEATAREKIIVVADARAVVDQTIGRPHERVVGIQSDLDPGEVWAGGDAEHWKILLTARDR